MKTSTHPDSAIEIAELRRMQQELRDSEERYRLIVESASDGIVTIDHDNLITEFNPAAEAIFGWKREQVMGRDLADIIIPPPLREGHRRGLDRHRDSDVAPRLGVRLELPALRADGSEFPIELTVSRVSGSGLPKFTAIIRDLTARREAEAEGRRVAERLRASESQYRSLFVDNPQPMCVYDPQTLRFLSVNAAGLAQYGYSEAELMTMTVDDLCPMEDREALRREVMTHPAQGQVRHFGRHMHKSGEIVYVELLSNDILFHGNRARLVLALDVTDKRRAARDLRHSEARFRALTELSADWYWEQDENLRFVSIQGGSRFFPLNIQPEGNIIGKTRWELEGTQCDGGWDEHRRQLERHEAFRDFEIRRRAADGSERILSLTGSPFFAKDGRFLGYRGVGRDITEQRRAQDEIARLNADLEERVRRRTAQLEAANAELEAFSYSIAHDLRSPLTSIDGFSHTLDELCGESVGEQGRHYLRRIRAGVRQMSDLTDAMLSLAQLSRVNLRWETVDLAAIARAVTAHLHEVEPHRDATVETPQHLHAKGDPRLLTQVITNLVGNAWKFSAAKPQTWISVGSTPGKNGHPVYYVADRGAGFDMAHSSRLFGAFQRLHAPSEFEGTGIGLALVQKIISRHAGRIWADARPGDGATFYFTLVGEPAS